MATNKRLNPMFSLKSYSKEELINEILIQRKIIAAYINWKGDGYKPNKKKNNPLNLEINKGENEYQPRTDIVLQVQGYYIFNIF